MLAANYKLVQMNLRPRTFDKLEELKERLHADNRTEAVKRCLQIADVVSKTIMHGGKVILEESDGTRAKLMLPDL